MCSNCLLIALVVIRCKGKQNCKHKQEKLSKIML